jgi:hypothetical protein
MGGGGAGLPSGSRSRCDGAVDPPRSAPRPAAARTRPLSFAARYTSAACRTGCPRHGPLDHPAAARLNRRWRPTRGDLTPQPAVGQRLPAGLVVVAGVQVHRGRIGQQPPAGPCTAVRVAAAVSRVAASKPSWRRLAGAGTAASGMPAASQATERLRPCLRRSTGLGPATWPPPGASVIQPSMARCSGSKPCSRVIGRQGELVELLGQARGDPLVAAAAQRGRRAGGVGDAAVAAAKHQDLDELVEDHGSRGRGRGDGGSPAGGGRYAPEPALGAGSTGAAGCTMAQRARDLPMTIGCEISVSIAARACLVPPARLAPVLGSLSPGRRCEAIGRVSPRECPSPPGWRSCAAAPPRSPGTAPG